MVPFFASIRQLKAPFDRRSFVADGHAHSLDAKFQLTIWAGAVQHSQTKPIAALIDVSTVMYMFLLFKQTRCNFHQ